MKTIAIAARSGPSAAGSTSTNCTSAPPETDLRLKRLYDAIENSVANPHDPALKERIAGLKAVRDQAQADAGRARAMAERLGQQAGGGYRRDRLRALAQRVEVADKEVRIMGSKGELLRRPAASSGLRPTTPG